VLNKLSFGGHKSIKSLVAHLGSKRDGWPVALSKPVASTLASKAPASAAGSGDLTLDCQFFNFLHFFVYYFWRSFYVLFICNTVPFLYISLSPLLYSLPFSCTSSSSFAILFLFFTFHSLHSYTLFHSLARQALPLSSLSSHHSLLITLFPLSHYRGRQGGWPRESSHPKRRQS
jgi:hypothetical protein